jgi:hypothetical protein
VALYDLVLNDEIGVTLGTGGVVVGQLGEDRLMVLFDTRVDSGAAPEGPVSVSFKEVTVQRLLVGGFSIAQRVQSSMDLVVGNKVVVKAGTRGAVLAEFSDTRLTVAFDPPEEGGQSCFNVLPLEIKPCCDSVVQSREDDKSSQEKEKDTSAAAPEGQVSEPGTA